MSTTFKQFSPGEYAGYDYGRSGNPTRQALEECLAPLEKAKYALTFASGLASLTTLSYLLKSGDHILTVDDVYGGTNRFFRNCANRMGIDTSFVNMLDLKETEAAFKPNTAVNLLKSQMFLCSFSKNNKKRDSNIIFFVYLLKMVWLETPTNPTLKLIDIKAVCDMAKKINPKIITVVDNTFASAFFQVMRQKYCYLLAYFLMLV